MRFERSCGTNISAGKDYEGQLEVLIEFMEATGVVSKENGCIRLAAITGAALAAPCPPPATTTTTPAPVPSDAKEFPPFRANLAPVSTGFSKPTEGMVNFHVSFRVDMHEMSGWSADRIAAFFAGIAQVLSAKGNIEGKAASV